MRTKKINNITKYVVTGVSGKEYLFKRIHITNFVDNSNLIITDSMAVYFFVKDATVEKPILIDGYYRKGWDFPFRDIQNYEKIKKYGVVDFLYCRVFQKDKAGDIYYDIIDGKDFDKSLNNK